jgi:hypothetical protein
VGLRQAGRGPSKDCAQQHCLWAGEELALALGRGRQASFSGEVEAALKAGRAGERSRGGVRSLIGRGPSGVSEGLDQGAGAVVDRCMGGITAALIGGSSTRSHGSPRPLRSSGGGLPAGQLAGCWQVAAQGVGRQQAEQWTERSHSKVTQQQSPGKPL